MVKIEGNIIRHSLTLCNCMSCMLLEIKGWCPAREHLAEGKNICSGWDFSSSQRKINFTTRYDRMFSKIYFCEGYFHKISYIVSIYHVVIKRWNKNVCQQIQSAVPKKSIVKCILMGVLKVNCNHLIIYHVWSWQYDCIWFCFYSFTFTRSFFMSQLQERF